MIGHWGGFDEPDAHGRFAGEQEIYLNITRRWRNIAKPTIAQVQGRCIAGGLMLAWACDLIIAIDDALFCDAVVAMAGQAAAKPALALKITKEAVSRAMDATGQQAAIDQAFGLHQLCNGHNLQRFGKAVDPAGLPPSVAGRRWLTILMNRINPALFSAAFTAWVRETWPNRAEAVADKSNELTAIPVLLARLAENNGLRGAIVSSTPSPPTPQSPQPSRRPAPTTCWLSKPTSPRCAPKSRPALPPQHPAPSIPMSNTTKAMAASSSARRA